MASNLFYGSLQNRIEGFSKQEDIKVGDGVTVLHYTDRSPGTIIEVTKAKDGSVKSFVVQEDKATRIDKNGFSEAQEYTYERNSKGRLDTFKRVSKGRLKGVWRTNGLMEGNAIRFGEREEYFDFSF